MVEKWVGKSAVVTGASAGIGAAIFEDLARNGVNVIGLARRVEKVEEMITKLGTTKGKTYAHKCDVSNPEEVTETFKWIEEKFGVLSILINNAGTGRNTNLLGGNEEAFKKINEVLDTNVRGLVQCTREAYRLMKKSDDYGYIININSIVGHYVPFTGTSMNVYAPSKFAVTAITEVIRQELVVAVDKKVRVTSLSPGRVKTDIRIAAGDDAAAVQRNYTDNTYLESEDISNAVLYLLSTPYSVNVTELTIKPVGEKI